MLFVVAVTSALLLLGPSLAQFTFRSTIGSHGAVKAFGVGVYWDSLCINPVSSVDWGLVEPDATCNVTIHLKNEGNFPVTLFLGAENWNPENASDYFTLTWDYGNETIDAGETLRVTLSLLTSSGVEDVKGFSFDIVIGGVG